MSCGYVALFPSYAKALEKLSELPLVALTPKTEGELVVVECSQLGEKGWLVLSGPETELRRWQEKWKVASSVFLSEGFEKILDAHLAISSEALQEAVVVFQSDSPVEVFEKAQEALKKNCVIYDLRVSRGASHNGILYISGSRSQLKHLGFGDLLDLNETLRFHLQS